MQRVIETLKAITYGMAIVFLVAVSFLAVQASTAIVHFDRNYSGTSEGVNETLMTMNEGLKLTFDNVNRPCGMHAPDKGLQPCGALAEAQKTAEGADDVLKRSDLLIRNEQRMLDQNVQPMLDRANLTLDHTAQATGDLHPLLLEATARTRELQGAELNAAALIAHVDASSSSSFAQLDTASRRLNALLADPAIPDTLHHFAGITASSDAMLFTANKVETKATYTYLNPSHNPAKRTWQVVSPFLLPTAQIGAAVVR